MTRPQPPTSRPRRRRVDLLPVWLLLPGVLVIAAIQLYPVLYTFLLSTQRNEAGTGRQIFVGLANFARLFTSPALSQSLVHTTIFLVGYAVLTMTAALIIALLLKQHVKLTPVYITLIFIPWIISDVIAGIVWRLFVVPDYGLFAPFFANPALFGEPNGISILTTTSNPWWRNLPIPPAPALLYLTVAAVWKILPFVTLLLLAALQTVPRAVLESASIDGANGWQSLRLITLPLIWPMLTVALFNLILGGINGVGMVFSLTGGGPGTSTEVLSYLLYSIGFSRLDFGLAAALSVFIAGVNFLLIGLILRTARAHEEYA